MRGPGAGPGLAIPLNQSDESGLNPTMYPKSHREAWEEMGKLDPLWAILSVPDKKHGRWDTEAFFRSAEGEVQELLEASDGLGRPAERGVAIDFGCGVGRVTRALSRHFGKCYGVDISASMVNMARDLNRDFPNCEFLVNESSELGMFDAGSIDLIYAHLVLMHLPSSALIESYLAEFLRVLKSDGLIVFQLPSHIPLRFRLDPRRRLFGPLRRMGLSGKFLYGLGLVPITMRAVAEERAVAFLRAHGGTPLEVRRSRDPSTGIESRTYFVTRQAGLPPG